MNREALMLLIEHRINLEFNTTEVDGMIQIVATCYKTNRMDHQLVPCIIISDLKEDVGGKTLNDIILMLINNVK